MCPFSGISCEVAAPRPQPFLAFQKIGNGLSSTPLMVSRIAAGWTNCPSGTMRHLLPHRGLDRNRRPARGGFLDRRRLQTSAPWMAGP